MLLEDGFVGFGGFVEEELPLPVFEQELLVERELPFGPWPVRDDMHSGCDTIISTVADLGTRRGTTVGVR